MPSPSSEVVRTWRVLPSLKAALERAADPTTSPAELVRLADHAAKAVRRLVAQNPNAPGEALDPLAEEFPAEVAENPALSLLSLADPTLAWMHTETVLALGACGRTPGWLLGLLAARGPGGFERRRRIHSLGCHVVAEMFSAQRSWWNVLAAHPNCPPDVLARLMACELPELRAAASSHPSAPRSLLELLLRAGSSEQLRAVASPGSVSEDELEAIASAGHWGRVLVLRHPSAPRHLRDRLLDKWGQPEALGRHTPYSVLAETEAREEPFLALFSNPSAEPEELESRFALVQRAADLSIHSKHAAPLLLALAKHAASPPPLLRTLSCSLLPEVRAAVAAHPSIDPAWLDALLAAGASPDLSRMVAAPPPVDPEHLAALATLDGFPCVLVASHPHIPARIVERLLRYRFEPVRRALLHNPALGVVRASQIALSGPLSLRRLLAEASWLPRHVFACLARADDAEVRHRLRTNPALPRDLVINE